MRFPLLGLESTLSDQQCDSVRLHSVENDITVVFSREGEDAWVPDNEESEPLHSEEFLRTIVSGFGGDWDRLECFLTREKVVYAVERGSVRIRREARETRGADAETELAGMKALLDALGIPKSKRKRKLKQATQFGKIVELALAGKERAALRILDLACGRSYLGFVLAHQLAARGRSVELHGVDSNPAFVDKSREIARTLQWTNSTFELGDLSGYSITPGMYDIVVSLHGCDTLTDEAIRIACEARVPLLFAAPCCQHELRYLWKAHPLAWVSRYGLLEQRLADVLTDGFRCLVLEALGYRVKVLRFAAPDVTPKNLLIQAALTAARKPERADAAWAFLKRFGVRPRLTAVLEAEFGRPGA